MSSVRSIPLLLNANRSQFVIRLKSKGIRIYDLLGVTTLVAVHFAAFRINASTHTGELAALLWLTPNVLTCLIHLRLRLKMTTAMIVYYVVTLLYTFLASLGQIAAINAYRLENPGKGRDTEIAIVQYAVSETITMAVMGIALVVVYGIVCYTAINAHTPGTLSATNENLTSQE